ncbi:MAG: hypothetical protein OXG85_10900 [Chloroflexi bacterium]|nr:hypothetical protein [Chloroflexota bacterium]
MKETQAYIERIKRVNRGYQRLELAVDRSLTAMRAGQALLVRRIDKDYDIENWDPYLRELWFPVAIQAGNIVAVERPARAHFVPGQLLSVLGPVGRAYRFRHKLRNVLLIAYEAMPAALLLMIPSLLAKQVGITLVLMGSARQYETNHLPEEVEVIQAEDNLTWSDMVMTLGWADQVFALVGQGDSLRFFGEILAIMRERHYDIPANYLFGVIQRDLPCGVGACHACALSLRGEHKLQCIDGPAFDLTELRLN